MRGLCERRRILKRRWRICTLYRNFRFAGRRRLLCPVGVLIKGGWNMKVLFAASECVPFVKTGGLADVAGALPPVLKQRGVDVRVILPLYSAIADTWKKQMMRTTKRIAMQTAPAIGTMNVKASTAETMSSRVLTMSSFNA